MRERKGIFRKRQGKAESPLALRSHSQLSAGAEVPLQRYLGGMRHGNTAGLGETWEEMDLFKINKSPKSSTLPTAPSGWGQLLVPSIFLEGKASWKQGTPRRRHQWHRHRLTHSFLMTKSIKTKPMKCIDSPCTG